MAPVGIQPFSSKFILLHTFHIKVKASSQRSQLKIIFIDILRFLWIKIYLAALKIALTSAKFAGLFPPSVVHLKSRPSVEASQLHGGPWSIEAGHLTSSRPSLCHCCEAGTTSIMNSKAMTCTFFGGPAESAGRLGLVNMASRRVTSSSSSCERQLQRGPNGASTSPG